MLKEFLNSSYLFGGNAPFIEELYEKYLANPQSIPEEWRDYFDRMQDLPGATDKDVAHAPVVELAAVWLVVRWQRDVGQHGLVDVDDDLIAIRRRARARGFAAVREKGLGPDPVEVTSNLWAEQIDAQERLEANWREIQEYVLSLMDWGGVDAVAAEELSIIPGLDEIFSLTDVKRAAEGDIRLSQKVVGILDRPDEIVLQTSGGDYRTKYLINCCGLQSDIVARMMGRQNQEGEEHRIIPFRGEYYKLAPEREFLVRNLIYPVPDPAFPFLGVHFTRMARGGVEAGPNAVFAYAREGYRHTDIHLGDLWRTISFKGFWAITAKYWRTGCGEFYRSLSKAAFVRALKKLLPEIREGDLVPGGAGVRAQAVEADGRLVDDFRIVETERAIHVLNAPSPGATASLSIGRYIAGLAADRFGLT